MLWDQRPPVLVMLTRLVENGKVITYQRHIEVCIHLENFAGVMMKEMLVLHWCMNVLGSGLVPVNNFLVVSLLSFLTYSPSVRGTGVMR